MIDMICKNARWFFYHSNLLEKDRQEIESLKEVNKNPHPLMKRR